MKEQDLNKRMDAWSRCPTNGREISFHRYSCHIHNLNSEPLEKVFVFHFYIQEQISVLEKAIQISDSDDHAARRYAPDDSIL